MNLTVEYLQKKFDKYNKEFFNGELPHIKIKIGWAKSTLGYYRYFTNRQTKEITDNWIVISRYWNRKSHDFDETLVHEMIHYYIEYKKIKDTAVHGVEFYKIANRINSQSDFHISAYGTIKPEIKSNTPQKTCKVLGFNYKGKTCYAKVSNKFDMEIANHFTQIKNPVFYETKSSYFNSFVESRSTIHFHFGEAVEQHVNELKRI